MALSTRSSRPSPHKDVTRLRRPADAGQAPFRGGSSDVAPDPDRGGSTTIPCHFQELKVRRQGERLRIRLLRHQSARRRRPNRRPAHCRSGRRTSVSGSPRHASVSRGKASVSWPMHAAMTALICAKPCRGARRRADRTRAVQLNPETPRAARPGIHRRQSPRLHPTVQLSSVRLRSGGHGPRPGSGACGCGGRNGADEP